MADNRALENMVFEEMEGRILFSADSAVLAQALNGEVDTQALPVYQPVVIPAQGNAPADVSRQQQGQRHEVVFIDGAVENAADMAAQLLARQDASRTLSVHVLDTTQDGVAQISAVLANERDVNGIHIISHGSDGELRLGNSTINNASLPGNAMAISGWGEALAAGGDILLYGCDVAQSDVGQRFVSALAQLAGADIEASNDLTGSSARGGDWELEHAQGSIETAIIADRAMQLSYSGVLSTIPVTNAGDGGAGSLAQAILDANANPGADTIVFAIPGTGVQYIRPTAQLPTITDTVYLDATQRSDYAGTPLIEIKGNYSGQNADGLFFQGPGASGSTVKGLAINFFGIGIHIDGASDIKIQGNYIGLEANGMVAHTNSGYGILVTNASNTLIGGDTALLRNVISGSLQNGIRVDGNADHTTIIGNYIGTNAAGTAALANSWAGIFVAGTNTVIGEGTAATRNLISGNLEHGIQITSSALDTSVMGNYIGTNAAGDAAIRNGWNGVQAEADNLVLGGSVAGQGNLISGNGQQGVNMVNVHNGRVQGNLIGTDAGGTVAVANAGVGLGLAGNSSGNLIGSSTAEARNIMSGNLREGVNVEEGVTGNQFFGNYVGLAATGTAVLGNGVDGILLRGTGNRIGSATAGTGNVVSGNGNSGIVILGSGNSVQGNIVGMDASGTVAFGNHESGIRVDAAASLNMIGGSADGEGNLVAHNGQFGVYIQGANATGNSILGNRIFANAELGINLGGTLPDTNDADDVDTGANNLQNYPVIIAGVRNGANTVITGSIHSAALTTYRLEFFVSAAPDVSGYGQAERRLGYMEITTDAAGNARFTTTMLAASGVTDWVTATATNLGTGDTSEFSFATQITGSNRAPLGSDNTVTAREDVAYVFTAADFRFTDPGWGLPDGFLSVFITSVPTTGSLTIAGVLVTAGMEIMVADIDAGKLRYLAATDDSGMAYASFGFRVRDDGGVADVGTGIAGVDTDPTVRLMTIDVLPVNDSPAGADQTIAILEDGSYIFQPGDFGFSDVHDTPANGLLQVFITSLPAHGTLTYYGATFGAGNYVHLSDLQNGALVYHAPANANGLAADSFLFQVVDTGGTANGGIDTDPTPRRMTFDITAVNDAPVGTDNTLTVQDNAAYVFTAADFGFTDPSDSPAHGFALLYLDSLPGTGVLLLDGVTLSAATVVTRAQLDAGKLVYAPLANPQGQASLASFTFRVADDGGTGNGGADTDVSARTMTLAIVSPNAAPVGADHTLSTREGAPYVFSAADFGFSDPGNTPAHNFAAVLITSIPLQGGLSNNGVALTVGSVVLRSDIDAGRLVFAPCQGMVGASDTLTLSFDFQVRDDGGLANGGQDTDIVARHMTLEIVRVVLPAPDPDPQPAPEPLPEAQPEPAAPAPLPPAVEAPVIDPPLIDSPLIDSPLTSAPGVVAPPAPGPSLPAVAPVPAPPAAAVTPAANASSPPAASAATHGAAAASSPSAATQAGARPDLAQSEVRIELGRAEIAHSFADIGPLAANLPSGTVNEVRAVSLMPGQQSGVSRNTMLAAMQFERRATALVSPPTGVRPSGLVETHRSASELGSEESAVAIRSTDAMAHRIETAVLVTALSAAWVASRKAVLVASLMATTPAWFRLDPLPILAAEDHPDDEVGSDDVNGDGQADDSENSSSNETVADAHDAGSDEQASPVYASVEDMFTVEERRGS